MNPTDTDNTTDTNAANHEEVTLEVSFPGYNKPVTLVSTKPRKKKNSDEHVINYVPKFEPSEVVDFLKSVVDLEKLANTIIAEIIKPAATEATSAARKVDAETGEPLFDEDAYVTTFTDQFNPASRRSSGESKKDLLLRLGALAPALHELVGKTAANPTDQTLKNQMAHIMLEIQEINNKIEAKSRTAGTRKKKAAKPAAAEPAATTAA